MKGINTVNVLSIDEEKLKFRVTATFSAPNINAIDKRGEYKFELPIPTALANSNEYNSCLIQCKGFQAYCLGAINDPVWNVDLGGAGLLTKVAALELHLDIPSSQTVTSTQNGAGVSGVGNNRVGGYREILFLDCHSVGDGVGGAALGGRSAAWRGQTQSGPILCGNPFGKTLTIRNNCAINDDKMWLVTYFAGAGANGADLGHYIYSFDITMVPNR